MNDCPSRFELARWEAVPEAERPGGLAAHVGSCNRCAAVFQEIGEARGLLLGADPAEASLRAARSILAKSSAKAGDRRRARRWLAWLAPALMVPAAVAVLLLVGPTATFVQRGTTKGNLILETYCKRGNDVFVASDGDELLAGDRLRFAYTQDRPGYLSIFGLDDQGRVFPYYDEHSLAGVPVLAGARILLPGSVELDDHKGTERIFALWSSTQLRDDAVRSAIALALARVNGDLRRITTLDLPVEQVSLLLRRP